MPAKNAIKQFKPGTMYHVYNRGVDKRIIFKDERDYAVFLSYLKYALLPPDEAESAVDSNLISEAARFNLRRLDLNNQVDLAAFCLMPNHFHLLLFQYSQNAITRLMRSIATGYSMYFNKRYERSGALFEGRYKAVEINTDSYWQHISRYIHLNPLDLDVDWRTYSPSSYQHYAKRELPKWLKAKWVLDGFSSLKEYENFVAEYIPRRAELKELEKELGL